MTAPERGQHLDALPGRMTVRSVLLGMHGGVNMPDVPMPDPDQDETTWNDLVAEWLAEYSRMVAKMSSVYTATLEELYELRDQRAAVRSFLGTNQIGE